MSKIAILGSGHGGCAAAVDLTARGFEVNLHIRRKNRADEIQSKGGLTGKGVQTGFFPIAKITTDLSEAIDGVDLIMLVVPSVAHKYYAAALAQTLDGKTPIFLNPGHTGGGLHFTHELRKNGYSGPLRTCETVTLTYISRMQNATEVSIFSYTTNLGFAAFPGKHQNELFELVSTIYPNIVKATNVLETGLSNINAIFHPPGMILNTGWIERTKGDFFFYKEGITEGVGRAIDLIDSERIQICGALDIKAKPFIDIFFEAGLTTENARATRSISIACEESEANALLRSPTSLDHRYIHEDVGFGLTAFSALAGLGKIKVPVIESFIQIASSITEYDYSKIGLTLEKLGLNGVKLEKLHDFLEEGAII